MTWTKQQLQDMTLAQLKPLANELQIKRISSMRKAELIEALLASEAASRGAEAKNTASQVSAQAAAIPTVEEELPSKTYVASSVEKHPETVVAMETEGVAELSDDHFGGDAKNGMGYIRSNRKPSNSYYPHLEVNEGQEESHNDGFADYYQGQQIDTDSPVLGVEPMNNANHREFTDHSDETRAQEEAGFGRSNNYGLQDRRTYSSGYSDPRSRQHHGNGNGYSNHTYVNNHEYGHSFGHNQAYIPHGSHNRVGQMQQDKDSAMTGAEARRGMRYNKIKDSVADARQVTGPLEIKPEGFGLIEIPDAEEPFDQIYVSSSQIQKFRLKTGDVIGGKVRAPKAGEKYAAMLFLEVVNGTETTKIIQEMDELMRAKPRETDSRFQESHTGVLMVNQEGYGFLRVKNYMPGEGDIYVAANQIRRYGLRTGDKVTGKIRKSGENDRNDALLYIEKVNGELPELIAHRPRFEKLVPIFPEERLTLETSSETMSTRMIDLFAPIGKGQRGMIVAPPKAGKTTLLKEIAKGIRENHPEVELIILLVDERPEEVTDMQRSIDADIVYSTFDQPPQNHLSVAEMVLERSKRLVEQGKDVVVLVDSLTRLTRANNLCVNPSGRTLSGGMDPEALYFPKKLFGSARNIENGASLTIIATALIETGSRMDDIVFEEFKGTGNMEINLERELAQRRIFPAINLQKSGTRRDDLLLTPKEQKGAFAVRKMYDSSPLQMTDKVINAFGKTESNGDFLARLETTNA